jgi:hypothetical protein
MKQYLPKVFKAGSLIIGLVCSGIVLGQEKTSKTYKEHFNVAPDAIVELNTSHADIAFETWDKNEVEVVATIELEGASPEEAKRYFENNAIEIVGNSSKVQIDTGPEASWSHFSAPVPPIIIDIPEVPDIEPIFLDLRIPDLPPMPELPPVPPVPMQSFDYDAYQKDGEKYLKQWKKEYEKSFDKEYMEKIEAWSDRMKATEDERKKQMEEWEKEHEEMMRDREEHREELQQQREEMKQMAMEQRQQAREQVQMAREQAREAHRAVIISGSDEHDAPNVFYRHGEGEGKNLKIKKTIKIKMPKSLKLKMNVRHGEVKLAENTRNLNATLSYARLLGATIDGNLTNITASYTPVDVLHWNYGALKTDFSDKVALKEVKNLDLKANSSNVTIDRLLNKASIENNLGVLYINSVADNFDSMTVVMQNGELFCGTPASAYSIQILGTGSKFSPPSYLKLVKTQNQKQTSYKGYHLSDGAKRSISIDSRYSEVVLED